jgi:hypothetical protein
MYVLYVCKHEQVTCPLENVHIRRNGLLHVHNVCGDLVDSLVLLCDGGRDFQDAVGVDQAVQIARQLPDLLRQLLDLPLLLLITSITVEVSSADMYVCMIKIVYIHTYALGLHQVS